MVLPQTFLYFSQCFRFQHWHKPFFFRIHKSCGEAEGCSFELNIPKPAISLKVSEHFIFLGKIPPSVTTTPLFIMMEFPNHGLIS